MQAITTRIRYETKNRTYQGCSSAKDCDNHRWAYEQGICDAEGHMSPYTCTAILNPEWSKDRQVLEIVYGLWDHDMVCRNYMAIVPYSLTKQGIIRIREEYEGPGTIIIWSDAEVREGIKWFNTLVEKGNDNGKEEGTKEGTKEGTEKGNTKVKTPQST